MVGNISDRQNESETTANTPAIVGFAIANAHSATARNASAASTLIWRKRRNVDRIGESGQDQRRSEQYTDVRTDRIERLGEVQATGCRALRTKRDDIRICGGLKH